MRRHHSQRSSPSYRLSLASNPPFCVSVCVATAQDALLLSTRLLSTRLLHLVMPPPHSSTRLPALLHACLPFSTLLLACCSATSPLFYTPTCLSTRLLAIFYTPACLLCCDPRTPLSLSWCHAITIATHIQICILQNLYKCRFVYADIDMDKCRRVESIVVPQILIWRHRCESAA
jgi:hypothetical protein